jgi:MerR family transcriptional regulator/heat shock protein HspR
MRVGLEHKAGRLPNGSIKIGAVAGEFHVSVDLLRLYEREGLLIPMRSWRGIRYFTEHDYRWIDTILRLVREAQLNLAAIRHLLSTIPCWKIRNCGFNNRKNCPITSDVSQPCWTSRAICPVVSSKSCYFCEVYRSAPNLESFRALLGNGARELE